MTMVVDFRKSDDPRDVIHRAVHLLTGGGIVVFPTEAVYVACAHALVPEAVERLLHESAGEGAAGNGSAGGGHASLVVKSVQEAIDYVPAMSPLARRLARRCWPGPITLALDGRSENGLLRAMPAATRQRLAPDGELWLRVPAHDCIQEVMRLMPAPLVARHEVDSSGQRPIAASSLASGVGKSAELVIDDGECRYAEASTVVRIEDGTWSIVRPGVATQTMIGRLASEVFLFVCTGNTCRSPLAEGLFRKMLADRLQCADDELSDHGYLVLSAGLAAEPGLPASPESIEVARRCGVDLRSHESQPVTDRLLEQADRIFVMTRAHREAILGSYPRLAGRVELLARDQSDISDPIGAGQVEYETCRAEIERHLRALIDELSLDSKT
jgi:protein-tyrosine phosphatase